MHRPSINLSTNGTQELVSDNLKTFEIDTLYDFLIEHKNEIDYVKLDYTWSPFVAIVETDYYFGTGENKTRLYRRISYSEIDSEYSFWGTVDKAIDFAESYSCWDGETLALDDSILLGELDSYNYNYDNDCPKEPDDFENLETTNLSFCGYVYFRNYKMRDYHPNYDGPMYRESEPDDLS